MTQWKAEIDGNAERPETMALCPACGQKLADIRMAVGAVTLRIKCRRCRRFVLVKIRGEGQRPDKKEE